MNSAHSLVLMHSKWPRDKYFVAGYVWSRVCRGRRRPAVHTLHTLYRTLYTNRRLSVCALFSVIPKMCIRIHKGIHWTIIAPEPVRVRAALAKCRNYGFSWHEPNGQSTMYAIKAKLILLSVRIGCAGGIVWIDSGVRCCCGTHYYCFNLYCSHNTRANMANTNVAEHKRNDQMAKHPS